MELLCNQMAFCVLVVCVLAKCLGEAAYMYFPCVPRIRRKRRGVLSRNVCMYYVWSSTVELTYNSHLECGAYLRIQQAARSLALFSVY